MAARPSVRKIKNQIRTVNSSLEKANADPCNEDRALWALLAVVSFAGVVGLAEDVATDPETILGDLLADLMHWCDVQQMSSTRQEPINFDAALARGRNHYGEEYAEEHHMESC